MDEETHMIIDNTDKIIIINNIKGYKFQITDNKLHLTPINDYLNEKDIPGVKDKDTAIIIENKKKRVNVSRKNTESECLKILQSHGIDNAETILKEISEARKGQSVPLQKVKLTEITR